MQTHDTGTSSEGTRAVSTRPSEDPGRAFVTGASEGLGRAFALRLAGEGHAITAVARNRARLEELIHELGGEGHTYLVADLASPEGIERCVECLRASHHRVLVNNAGHSRFGAYAERPVEEELAIVAVNCGAAMALAHAFLSRARPGDALINLSSITYFLPTPIQPTYVATKCFLGSFSESLWYQQRSRGIYVQGLCPGITRTRFLERAGLRRFLGLLDLLAMTPERVVDASIRAMQRGRGPIVVPGLANRTLALLCRVLPRRLLVAGMGRLGDLAEDPG